MDHPDVQQDVELIKPLAEAVNYLLTKCEEQDEKIAKLESMIVEELFGGIEKLYKENQKTEGLTMLKGKYGALFDPHMEAYGKMYPGSDLYENLYGLLEESKSKEDFDEGQFDQGVQGVATKLAQLISELKGDKPASVEVEVESKPEVKEAPQDDDAELKSIIGKLSKSPTMRG